MDTFCFTFVFINFWKNMKGTEVKVVLVQCIYSTNSFFLQTVHSSTSFQASTFIYILLTMSELLNGNQSEASVESCERVHRCCTFPPGPHFSQPFPPGWVGSLSPTIWAATSVLRSPLPWYRLCRAMWCLVDVSKHRYVFDTWCTSCWWRQNLSPVTCEQGKR